MTILASSYGRRRTRYALRTLTDTAVTQSDDKTLYSLALTFGAVGACHLDQPGDSETWLTGIGNAYSALANNIRIGSA